MLKNIIHFLKYNNLTTLAVAAVLVGSGGAFAASPELRAAAGDAFVGRTETIVVIDNAALLSADFGAFDPALIITAVSEDAERYLVSYRFDTFDVLNGAWQKTERTGELKASKNALGDSDLRAYVTKELGEVARQEIRYLKEVQLAEREKGATKQMIAVSYAGLLGLVIDSQEKEVIWTFGAKNLGVELPSADISPVLSDDLRPIIDHLVVQPLSEEITPAEETIASSTPSAIEHTTLTESATTTDPATLIAPIETLAATPTAETSSNMTNGSQSTTNDGVATTPTNTTSTIPVI